MSRAIIVALLGACAIAPSVAAAQDVVVMRRTVSQGVFSEHRWDEGTWTGPAACSAKAPETRVVRCVRRDNGAVAPDANCHGAKPQQKQEVARYDGCTYAWDYSEYGKYAEACSDATSRSRTATCLRSGAGSPVVTAPDQASCTGTKEPLTQEASNYAGCTFTWKSVAGACSGDRVRSRTVTCERSGGSSATKTVAEGCADASRPTATYADDACATYTGTWSEGEWTAGSCNAVTKTQPSTRTATCTSTTGVKTTYGPNDAIPANGACNPAGVPNRTATTACTAVCNSLAMDHFVNGGSITWLGFGFTRGANWQRDAANMCEAGIASGKPGGVCGTSLSTENGIPKMAVFLGTGSLRTWPYGSGQYAASECVPAK